MFEINDRKGFQITFDNEWTVSIQFGIGNYCQHYHKMLTTKAEYWDSTGSSSNAEIAAWDKHDKWYTFDHGDTVDGYKSADEVLDFIYMIKNK